MIEKSLSPDVSVEHTVISRLLQMKDLDLLSTIHISDRAGNMNDFVVGSSR